MTVNSREKRGRRLGAAALAATLLVAACGGNGEPETRFHATRVIAFGDESSLIVDTRNNGNGSKFTVNATVSETDQTLVCGANAVWSQSVAASYGLFFPECNPSGVVAGVEEVREIGRRAERAGWIGIADEVYLDLVGDAHPPAATLSPALVSTNSLTKAYGLASLRCGWALGSPDAVERIRRARDVVDVWSPIPSDRLSVLAFRDLDRLAARARRIVDANSRLVRAFLERRPELECLPPAATIAFPRFVDGRDSAPFAERLLRDHGVAVVPGAFFDLPAHFRIAFGGATAALEEGLRAIEKSLAAEG